jgi:hypothetical protein
VREPFAAHYARLERQLNWLIDLQRLFEPTYGAPAQPPTGAEVSTRVDDYLRQLSGRTDLDETDAAVAQHIIQTFRNRWWGLFQCYDVAGLPATNNGLEAFLGRLKSGQRRVTGRKSVNHFVLRYGTYAALVDLSESKTDLLARLRVVDRAAYQRERQQLQAILGEARSRHRFRHDRETVLQELEAQWAVAVETAAQRRAAQSKHRRKKADLP